MKMESNDQNRNFTISAKVTAQQKAIYTQKAIENNLSTSEWISSILDISTNAYEDINKPIEKLILLEEENKTKDGIIKRLTSDLENSDYYIITLEHKISKQAKSNLELKNSEQNLLIQLRTLTSEKTAEITNNDVKTPQLSQALYSMSILSFLISALLQLKK
jgi:hypothetical protein